MNYKHVAVLVGLTVACMGAMAFAATKGDPQPKATNGAVLVLNSAATQIFTSSTGMVGRNAFALYNNGPNTIWCGWKSNVTTATGFPVTAGGALSVDLVSLDAAQTLYCIASTADQVSPADTRWIQVK